MTTGEKLKHFQGICMEDTRGRNAKMLDDYINALEKAYGEHTADTRRWANMQVETKTEELEYEINKRFSVGQLDFKREFSRRQEELKSKLLVEPKDKLANFMEIQKYQQPLDRQVEEVKAFVGNEGLTICMDLSGGDKLQRTAMHRNADTRLSEYSLTGGIRAVTPGKHIPIDNSFETRLSEARHEFKFDLGDK